MSEAPVPDMAADRLSTAVQVARLAIRWERLWQVLWAPVAVIGLFIGIALTDVLPLLPDIIHAIGLALLALTLGDLHVFHQLAQHLHQFLRLGHTALFHQLLQLV